MSLFHKVKLYWQALWQERKSGSIPIGIIIFSAILYLYFNPFFRAEKNPNEMSRLYLAHAISERGALDVGKEFARFGYIIDKSEHDGKVYSDKAPGVSLIAVPPVFIYKKVTEAFKFPFRIELALFFARIFAITLPMLLFLFLLYQALGEVISAVGMKTALIFAYALGTSAFPFSVLLFSHQLAAILVFSSFYLAYSALNRFQEKKLRYLLISGLLGGFAVLVEYTTLIPVFIIGCYVLFKERSLKVGLFALGAIPFAVILMLYNYACFGSPFTTGYAHLANNFADIHSHGLMGITYPHTDAMIGLLLDSSRGLLPLSPFLALGIVGLFLLPSDKKELAIVSLLITVFHWLLISSFAHWMGGWTLGPRHLTVILPFLMIGCAAISQKATNSKKNTERILMGGLILYSMLVISTATAVFPYFPEMFTHPFSQLTVPLWVRGLSPTGPAEWIFGLSGTLRLLVWFAIFFVPFYVTAKSVVEDIPNPNLKIATLCIMLIVTVVLFYGKSVLGEKRNHEQEERLQIVIKYFDEL